MKAHTYRYHSQSWTERCTLRTSRTVIPRRARGVSTTGRRWALLPGIPAGKHDGPSQFITSKDVIPYTPLPSEQSSDRGSPSDSIVAELSRAAAEAGAPAVGSTQRAIGLVQQEAATSALITEPKKQAASRQFIKVAKLGSPPALTAADSVRGTARWVLYAVAGVLALTLLRSLFTVASKYTSPTAVRSRTVNKNKINNPNNIGVSFASSPSLFQLVVDVLNQYLPANRIGLTPGEMGRLRLRTGFTATEIFRKYLWYLLRERAFDEAAVEDLLSLRSALSLSNAEVADALRERAQRIYDKYGNVMMDVAGLSKAGVDRKATCRALFSKLLYLAEYDQLLPQESEAAKGLDIPSIFGATDDDTAKLRIISLVPVDIDNLETQFTKPPGDGL